MCSFFLSPDNVAIGRSCNISSRYPDPGFGNQGPFNNNCSAAINGNSDANYVKGNCIHTAATDSNPHWTVYLGQEYTIHWITIYARCKKATLLFHQRRWCLYKTNLVAYINLSLYLTGFIDESES